MTGAPGEIRTPYPLVRSQVLYPNELRTHLGVIGAPRGTSSRHPTDISQPTLLRVETVPLKNDYFLRRCARFGALATLALLPAFCSASGL